jgi:hypothetical protein
MSHKYDGKHKLDGFGAVEAMSNNEYILMSSAAALVPHA